MKKLIIGIVVGITIGMMSTAYALSEEQKIDIYTDEETKIQYIIVSFTSTAGAGVGICPRYTSSGNLYYVGSKIVEYDDRHDGRKQKTYSL